MYEDGEMHGHDLFNMMRGIVSVVGGFRTVLMVSKRTLGLWQLLVMRYETYFTLLVITTIYKSTVVQNKYNVANK